MCGDSDCRTAHTRIDDDKHGHVNACVVVLCSFGFVYFTRDYDDDERRTTLPDNDDIYATTTTSSDPESALDDNENTGMVCDGPNRVPCMATTEKSVQERMWLCPIN